MTTATAPHRLWRNARYLTWLASDTSKGLAAALSGFAIPLLALVVTNDPAQAGIIAGSGLVARLLTTLVGGVLADRHRRVVLMLVGSLLGIALATAFTLLARADALTVAVLFTINLLLAARSGLFDVAGESALKELVPDDATGRAQAANQGRDAALQLAGGPLGGLLLGVGGWAVGLAMTVCHVLAAATAGALARGAAGAVARGVVRENGDERADARRVALRHATDAADGPGSRTGIRPSALAELGEAFRWLLSRPDLGGVLAITTIVNLGFNAAITTTIYALQQDGRSELLIGALSAGVGAVMLAGAVIAPLLVPRIGAGILTVTALSVIAVATVVLSWTVEPWAIIAVLGAAVLLVPALNAGMMGYFMVATPSHLLGRANSAAGALGMGALPLGPLIAGFGLAWFGRQNTILVCAGLCTVAVMLAIGNRALRALPVEARWAEHARRYEL
ncbi:MFS transporter [Microbacterium sp. NPDC008134]|uniref:MFS transporter n=1 Tax=Microbacterium sp. NPDC008134 TaxID=3364183 RepID=UPI0036EF1613